MASKTEIANRALAKLGQPRVANIETDNSKAPKALNEMYDQVRDALLAEYPWNFALTRAQLAKDATSPAWDWANAYTVPSDFLSLVEVKNNPAYSLERGKILTNQGAPIYILYVARIDDAGEFDALFVEAFASRLALEGVELIVESNTKKQLLMREYQDALKVAFMSDAIQNQPVIRAESEWLLARNSYSDEIDYSTAT